MHANRFLALHYANKGRLKIALSSIGNGALVCSTYVASGSVAKRSLIAAEGRLRIADKMEQRKSENVDDTKQITDGLKQNKRGKELQSRGDRYSKRETF
ncbi:hypothetical protein T11_8786 [Trichinella zimbabwensis]|uniref:Uncharacterized protein n=1 Tax=Trichinella zimbabwensis TaxID=268475 RepID=A0A0V1HYE7_9BILA|nr:hypothetical protein T11_8786 [Trichinella zimbabwensis]